MPSEEDEENVQDDIENHDSGHDGNNYDDANSDSDEHQNDDYCFNNNFVFKRQNGGLVYLAINDILNHYDTKKKAAHAVKTAKHGVSFKIDTKTTVITKKIDCNQNNYKTSHFWSRQLSS